jgi:hypothetical protein
MQEILQKQTIRNNAEFIGFFVRTTIKEETRHNEDRLVKKKKFCDIQYRNFFKQKTNLEG